MALPRTGLGLRDIFTEAFYSNPYRAVQDQDLSTFSSMMRRSPGVDLYRQYAPRWMGGYSQQQKDTFDAVRAARPEVRNTSLRPGDYPILDDQYPLKPGRLPELARRSSQAAGALASDITNQGALNIYWFLNAVEAASMAAGQQGMYGALKGIPDAPAGNPIRSSMLKVAATYPLVLGAAAASGSLFRQPGYAAVLPSEEDRRESEDPITERLLRTVGRAGKLLPYEEFSQERPDVSRADYERYKAYLHGDRAAVVRATGDGIHGPEVNILGKSLPLLTGVVPLVGGVLAGRAGVRMAGNRLASGRIGGVNQFKEQATRQRQVDAAKRQQLYDAQRRASAQDRLVEGNLLGGAVAGTAAGLTVTAAAANLLEQMRRAAAAEESRRKAAEDQLAAVETQRSPSI